MARSKKIMLTSIAFLLALSSGAWAGELIKSGKTPRGNYYSVRNESITRNKVAVTLDGKKLSGITLNNAVYIPLYQLPFTSKYDKNKWSYTLTSNKKQFSQLQAQLKNLNSKTQTLQETKKYQYVFFEQYTAVQALSDLEDSYTDAINNISLIKDLNNQADSDSLAISLASMKSDLQIFNGYVSTYQELHDNTFPSGATIKNLDNNYNLINNQIVAISALYQAIFSDLSGYAKSTAPADLIANSLVKLDDNIQNGETIEGTLYDLISTTFEQN